MNPMVETMERWVRLMKDGVRGTAQMGGWLDPGRAWRFAADSQRLHEEFVETWLRAWDMVPRRRYLEVLEQNEKLRRRVAELEGRKSDASEPEQVAEDVSRVMKSAFDEMLSAQRAWFSAFTPSEDSTSEKP